MNNFNIRQNRVESIDKLAAQNQLYGDAKKRLGIYLVLSIPIMMVLNIAIKPLLLCDWLGIGSTIDLTDSIALYALLLSAYELIFLKRKISNFKKKAAKIQEDFDCTVYDMEWNDILCGDKVCDVEIKKSSDKYIKKGKCRESFVDWYTPDVESVDHTKAILLCQKENLGWDIEQRKKYVYFISIIAFLVFASSVVVAFYLKCPVNSFILSVIIPSWPAIGFAVNSYFENKEAIENKKFLKSAVDKVEQVKKPTIKYVRNIQNLIYLNRMDNCLIFDWFYKYLWDMNQTGVSYATKQLIQRLL